MTTNLTFNDLPDEMSRLSNKLDQIYQLLNGTNRSSSNSTTNEESSQWMLIKQACDFLHVSKPTLYRYRKERKIATYKNPQTGKIYFKKQDLIDYIQNGKCRSRFEIEQTVLQNHK